MECAVDMMMMMPNPNAIPDEESEGTEDDIYEEDHLTKHLILIDISNPNLTINVRHEIQVGEEAGDLIINHTGTLVATIQGGYMELYQRSEKFFNSQEPVLAYDFKFTSLKDWAFVNNGTAMAIMTKNELDIFDIHLHELDVQRSLKISTNGGYF